MPYVGMPLPPPDQKKRKNCGHIKRAQMTSSKQFICYRLVTDHQHCAIKAWLIHSQPLPMNSSGGFKGDKGGANAPPFGG